MLLEGGGEGDELITGIGSAGEDGVFEDEEVVGRDIGVSELGRRIHNGHIHTSLPGMIKEDCMHRLTKVVIATEGETEVRDAAADMRPR